MTCSRPPAPNLFHSPERRTTLLIFPCSLSTPSTSLSLSLPLAFLPSLPSSSSCFPPLHHRRSFPFSVPCFSSNPLNVNFPPRPFVEFLFPFDDPFVLEKKEEEEEGEIKKEKIVLLKRRKKPLVLIIVTQTRKTRTNNRAVSSEERERERFLRNFTIADKTSSSSPPPSSSTGLELKCP